MARKGLVSPRVDRFARALNLHPCIQIKNDRPGIGGAWTGSIKKAYSRYISRAFPTDSIPDQDILFITYVNIPAETLTWIRTEISKLAYFENVIFVQASAAAGRGGMLGFENRMSPHGGLAAVVRRNCGRQPFTDDPFRLRPDHIPAFFGKISFFCLCQPETRTEPGGGKTFFHPVVARHVFSRRKRCQDKDGFASRI